MQRNADAAANHAKESPGPKASRKPMAKPRILLFFVIVGAAVLLLLETTRQGIGLRGDSLAYIGGARNISSGLGFSRVSGGGEIKAISHFPPVYPYVLAGAGLLGPDPLDAARVINAVLFGLNAALCGLIVWEITRSSGFALLAAFLLASNKTMIDLHSWAMSEGLYITLLYAFLILLDQSLRRRSIPLVLMTGLLAGVAFLTRYVGVSLIGLGVSATFLLRQHGRRWITELALMIGGFALPVVPWLVRNAILTGTPTNRRFMWHPIELAKVQEGVASFWSWILPDKLQRAVPLTNDLLAILSIGMLAALGGYFLYAWSRRRKAIGSSPEGEPHSSLGVLLAGSVLVYLATVSTSLYLFDASTPLDYRILSPIYVGILPLLVVTLAWFWEHKVALAKPAVVAAALLLMLASIDDAIDVVRSYRFHGIGLNAVRWRQSETLQALKDLSPAVIYTNEWDLVYFHTGKSSYPVFNRFDAVTFRDRPQYDEWLAGAAEGLKQEGAALVLFGETWDGELSDYDREMFDGLTEGLAMLGEYADGIIFVPERR